MCRFALLLVALVAALAVAAIGACWAALGAGGSPSRLSGTYQVVEAQAAPGAHLPDARLPHAHLPGTPADHVHDGPAASAQEHWLHTAAGAVRLHLPAGLPPVPPGPVEVTGVRLSDGSLQVTRVDVMKP